MLASIPTGIATLTISKQRITFNKDAKLVLKLKKEDCFVLVQRNSLLYYKEAPAETGFKIHFVGKETPAANSFSLLKYLNLSGPTKFQISEFKEGMRELRPLKKEPNPKPIKK